jgi:hypothetical protein
MLNLYGSQFKWKPPISVSALRVKRFKARVPETCRTSSPCAGQPEVQFCTLLQVSCQAFAVTGGNYTTLQVIYDLRFSQRWDITSCSR